MSGSSSRDYPCNMNLYLKNVTGGPMTLQNVAAVAYAPGVMHVVPAGGSIELIAWAYDWDSAGTVSYNTNDGVVLNIAYSGGSLDEINATFMPFGQTSWQAQKASYANGLLITVTPQGSGGSA